ncbi:MAG: NAD-binding protein [Micropruina sp.]
MAPASTRGGDHRSAFTNVLYLFLRRMRFPLVLIIVLYTITVVGLSMMPGIDADGNPTPGMGLFLAFYVISYTGTTIGFGELPFPYSTAQRLWMTLSIYLTVLGWSYSVVTVLSLVQEPAFMNALKAGRFARRINQLREPFYLVCGCGETGTLVCHGLDRLGFRFVVVEQNPARLQELRLEDFRSDAPMIVADAAQPGTLISAGLTSPWCRGVMALAVDDETNRAIAVTVRLLAPKVPVLARIGSAEGGNQMGAFGGDMVINPFERFARYLAAAVVAPESYRLREILTGLPGDDWPEEHRPPGGHWVMCGYGRFGHMIREELCGAGLTMTVIDRLHYGEPGVDIQGTGVDAASLRAAGIEHSTGIVAGNANDLKNLAIAITARELKPDLFVVTRQNQNSNAPLFKAFEHDLAMVPSRIVAREFLALITTPLLARFLAAIPNRDEAWCTALIKRLARVNRHRVPEVWSVKLASSQAEAIRGALVAGHRLTAGTLLTDPYERAHRTRGVLLMVARGSQVFPLPDHDFQLQRGDELLFAGSEQARRRIDLVATNENVLNYVRGARDGAGGWLWQWLEDRRNARTKAGDGAS